MEKCINWVCGNIQFTMCYKYQKGLYLNGLLWGRQSIDS